MYRYGFIAISLIVAFVTSFYTEMRKEIDGPCACIVQAATVYDTTLVVSVDTLCGVSVVNMEMSYKYLHHFGATISANLVPTVAPCDRYNYEFPFPPSIVEYVLVSSLTGVLLSLFASVLIYFINNDKSYSRACRETIIWSSLAFCVLTGVQFVSFINIYHTITIPVFVIGFTINFIASTIGLGLSFMFLRPFGKLIARLGGFPTNYVVKTDEQLKHDYLQNKITEIIEMGGDIEVIERIIEENDSLKTVMEGNSMV